MSRNNPLATAVDLPNQGIAPMIEPTDNVVPEAEALREKQVDPEVIPSDLVLHEETMPEGPTVTRWEEWA